ncbi:putative endopeptidase La [Dioscorea sansibarensis]
MALVPQILPSPPLLRQVAATATATATALPFPLFKPLTPPSTSRTALFSSPQDRRTGLSIPHRCSSSDPGGTSGEDLVELPLFPLPLVLFPGAILPLQIFEFRYRIMMHTLLQSDLRFGVIFSESGTIADVGCVGEIVKHERLVDDRFFLICKGQERFRVSGIVRTRPYLVARVSWLEDRPPPQEDEDVDAIASEVETYMRDVIRISNRLNGKPEKEGGMDLRRNLFPTPFSFFVGSTFEGAPREQQALLELEDTAARLKRERDTLRNTLNYLTAASAVKDAFPSSPSSSS